MDIKRRFCRLAGVVMFIVGSPFVFAQTDSQLNDPSQRQLQGARRAIRAKDYTSAMEILRPLASHGNKWAEHYVGIAYYFGEGVEMNHAEALRWFRKAADQSLAAAKYYIGVMYAEGDVVQRDDVEAARWYESSAKQDYAPAELQIAWAYARGLGVLFEPDVALTWFGRAAENGEEQAQYELGQIYLTGWSVKKDLVEGYKWLAISAGSGSEEGKQAMESARKLLSPSQLKQATEAARDWLRKEGLLTRPVDELLTVP